MSMQLVADDDDDDCGCEEEVMMDVAADMSSVEVEEPFVSVGPIPLRTERVDEVPPAAAAAA